MQKFIQKITSQEPNRAEFDCFILSADAAKNYKKEPGSDKIFLVENDAELCKELDLDGVVLDLSKSETIKKDFLKAQDIIGKNKIIGIITRNRRHEAMIISEFEPDFIVFKVWKDGLESTIELINWYSELFVIQSAIILEDEGIDYAKINADIVIKN